MATETITADNGSRGRIGIDWYGVWFTVGWGVYAIICLGSAVAGYDYRRESDAFDREIATLDLCNQHMLHGDGYGVRVKASFMVPPTTDLVTIDLGGVIVSGYPVTVNHESPASGHPATTSSRSTPARRRKP